MEAVSTPQAPSRASWTFADLASTYRFWALMVATMAVTFGALAINLALQWLPDLRELAKHGHTLYTSTQIIAGVAGVALGLLLAHSRTVAGLMTAIAVSAVIFGALAAYGEDAGLGLICLASFVSRAVAAASPFAVFVYLSGGSADRLAFAGALAVATTAFALANSLGGAISAMLMHHFSSTGCFLAGLTAMALALLLLAPVRGALFETAPVPRHRPLRPTGRVGATVAMVTALPWLAAAGLALLGGFGIGSFALVGAAAIVVGMVATAYWLYRVHGESASLYPTQKLFTPRGALLMYLLVPMALPILLLCLGGVLREARAQRGEPLRSAAWFNAWCIVFPPIAMAMAQETLNELAGRPER